MGYAGGCIGRADFSRVWTKTLNWTFVKKHKFLSCLENVNFQSVSLLREVFKSFDFTIGWLERWPSRPSLIRFFVFWPLLPITRLTECIFVASWKKIRIGNFQPYTPDKIHASENCWANIFNEAVADLPYATFKIQLLTLKCQSWTIYQTAVIVIN